MVSPETVRISHAAALTVGFKKGRFFNGAKLGCVNLLQISDKGCRANCAYCGQAFENAQTVHEKCLIRVDWPEHGTTDVVSNIDTYQQKKPHVQRVCVGSLVGPKEALASIDITKRVNDGANVKISALLSPTSFSKEDLIQLRDAGAENITIAVDCVTERLFDGLRGKGARSPHRWERYMEGIKEALEVMGPGYNRVGVHVIIGLGETEEEAMRFMQQVYDWGATVHLFAFFPEEGIAMEEAPPVPLEQYRHAQLARHLMDRGLARVEQMSFTEEGALEAFGIDAGLLNLLVDEGVPFMTTGCSGCNRPFSNETPSMAMRGELRNYPWQPMGNDVQLIRDQLIPFLSSSE